MPAACFLQNKPFRPLGPPLRRPAARPLAFQGSLLRLASRRPLHMACGGGAAASSKSDRRANLTYGRPSLEASQTERALSSAATSMALQGPWPHGYSKHRANRL
jgi:hypothetical protein